MSRLVSVVVVVLCLAVPGSALADECFPPCRDGYACQAGKCVAGDGGKPAPPPTTTPTTTPPPTTTTAPPPKTTTIEDPPADPNTADPNKTTTPAAVKTMGFGIKGVLTGTRYFLGGSDYTEPPPEVSINQKFGFGAGGFLRYRSGRLIIQPELMIVMKGGASSYDDGMGYTAEASETDIWVEVPILVGAVFSQSSDFSIYGFIGPSFAFLLSANVEISDSDGTSDSQDVKDQLNGFAILTNIGLGVEIPMGPSALLIDLRYSLGLTNLPTDDTLMGADIISVDSAFMLSAGYRF